MLDDGDAAPALNLPETGGPVVKFPGKHHARDSVTVRESCRTKSYIDARAVMLLLRPHADVDVIFLHEQVMIRPGNVDFSRLDAFSVPAWNSGERACSSENLRKKTLRSR